ncbi:MAG TPA: glycosyltransferase family 4 protein [Candidatus Sulfotelmatobacter sp.]|jgi:glycogen(starch) synthase|nr:glycosyltransferase family 4 protein [Candidatus Sulfotelmatobacter sp.]
MKILVVTNLYPPQHIGGYELGCRDVVEKLRVRGHVVRVLTGDFQNSGTENPLEEKDVARVLRFIACADDARHDKPAENAKLIRALEDFSPDIVYFWNQAGLCLWLPFTAHWHGARMAFYLSDANCISWRIAAWLSGAAQKNSAIKKLFGNTFLVRGWPVVENRTCHFCSDFIRQTALKNGITYAPKNSVVAHWGIELKNFSAAPRPPRPAKRILYAGQLIPQKGVHTAIAAVGMLAREKGCSEITFSIAGGGMHPDYEKELHEMASRPGLAGKINFLGKVPRADLPGIYRDHDILVFPSEWDEPFAITPLEAIASGLAVAGTTTGGSSELFRERETAMTFRAGDAADCARAIRELCADENLLQKISANAQREVREKHTLDAMVDKIEASLLAEIKD